MKTSEDDEATRTPPDLKKAPIYSPLDKSIIAPLPCRRGGLRIIRVREKF